MHLGKKLPGLILAMLLVVLAAGCATTNKEPASPAEPSGNEGAAQTGGEQVTIEFVYWAGAGGEEKAFENLIAEFEAQNPDIKVNANLQPSGDDFHTRIQTRIAGNEAPDVFRLQYQRMGNYTSANALLDVTDLIAGQEGNFNPSLLRAVTSEGKYFGMPHHTDTLAVFYNKTYLDQLGITPPVDLQDAWTWEEFLDAAKKIQDAGLAEYGIAFNWKAGSAYRSLPFLFQNNATLLTDDLSQGNLNTPEAVESFAFLQRMFKDHMSPGNSMMGSDDFNLLFTTGRAGMLINGNWMIPRYEQEMKDYEWGVTYMPVQRSAASDMGGNALAIPYNTKHPEAAKRFLAFAAEKENMKKFVEQGLFIPARTDIDGDFNYTLENPEFMRFFIEQAGTVPPALADTVTMGKFASINRALGDALEELFMLGKDPKDAASALNEEINKILKE